MGPCMRLIDWMSSVSLAMSLKNFIRPRSLFVSGLLILTPHALINEAYGQECPPAVLKYIVRDEKGRNFSEAELKAVVKQMPRFAPEVSSVSLTADGKILGEYAEAKEAKTELSALYYADVSSCRLNISRITLQYAGKTMRLIFDLVIDGRSVVVDSRPFQAGTFRLDLKAVAKDGRGRVIPAKRWKKIKDNP
jgi:hypothetical protein